MKKHKGVEDWRTAFSEEGKFAMYLSDFLHHADGAKDKRLFRFANELECNVPAPRITVSKIYFTSTPEVFSINDDFSVCQAWNASVRSVLWS